MILVSYLFALSQKKFKCLTNFYCW